MSYDRKGIEDRRVRVAVIVLEGEMWLTNSMRFSEINFDTRNKIGMQIEFSRPQLKTPKSQKLVMLIVQVERLKVNHCRLEAED